MSTEDLFYRPHIEPTRNYRSDGVILHEEPDNSSSIESKKELTNQEETYKRNAETVDRLLRIRKITPLLPQRIVETINTIVDTTIAKIYIENEKKIRPDIEKEGTQIVLPPPDEEGSPEIEFVKQPQKTKESESQPQRSQEQYSYQIPTSGESDEDGDYEWPEMTSSGLIFDVQKNKDIWDVAKEQSQKDLSLICEDFSHEYSSILEGYIYQLLTAMDEAGISNPEALNFEYEGETVTGVPENYQHLNDIIVRNQSIINEKSAIFRKTHDLYSTSAAFASFDTISQERTRYLKEKYKETISSGYLEMYDKNLLVMSREEYENKYRQARSNIYKFLHSTAILSADMLSLALASNVAKCSLIKKGVDIFKKKEYENTTYSNSTQTTKEDKNKKESEQKNTEQKATDTSKKESSDVIPLTVGNGIGGAIKNSVKDAIKDTAKGTVKTVANEIKAKVAIKNKDKEQKKP